MTFPGFFTQGVEFELPHPSVNVRVFLVLQRVLERALQLLRDDGKYDLASMDEDAITFQIHWVIENRLLKSGEVPGFDRSTFPSVSREGKVCSFDGAHPDKMPDLIFALGRDTLPVISTEDAVMVECKPVDDNHTAGEHYCKGLRRFVDGEYAWAMQDAMMMAYVRGGRTIKDNLVPALLAYVNDDRCVRPGAAPRKVQRRNRLGTDANLQVVKGSQRVGGASLLQWSMHLRGFAWLDDHGQACSIRLFHTWHSCP